MTLAIALLSGALSGFLCSKAGEVVTVFDDEEHWNEVDFDDKRVESEHRESEEPPHDHDFDVASGAVKFEQELGPMQTDDRLH